MLFDLRAISVLLTEMREVAGGTALGLGVKDIGSGTYLFIHLSTSY